MTKLIYFTAGIIPTETEAGHIAVFEAYPGLDVVVRNAAMVDVETNQGATETADYVANATGADFPEGYTDTGDYPIADPDNPPAPDILATQKIITSGVEFLSDEASGVYVNGYTPTIAAGVVGALAGS